VATSISRLLQENIDNRLFLPTSSKSIICEEQKIWQLIEALYTEAALRGKTIPRQSLEQTIECMLKGNWQTLMVLAYLDCSFDELWKFVRLACEECLDQRLPSSKESLEKLWDLDVELQHNWGARSGSLGTRVFIAQGLFLPFTFRENENNLHDDKRRPLPVTFKRPVGQGSSAIVYEYHIAEGGFQWTSSSKDHNTTVLKLAEKVYRHWSSESEPSDLHKELDALKRIDEARTTHKNVVRYYGSLDDGEHVSLFFELADLDTPSLAALFRSEKRFEESSLRLFMESLAGLALGLDHLHNGIESHGDQFRIYHNDFRPDNILIFGNEFKVADLGLSRIRACRLTQQDDPSDGSGKYANLGSSAYKSPDKNLSTTSEVFSLGCIVLVAISYKIGGPTAVEQFATLRKKHGTYQFWMEDAQQNRVLKPGVVLWIDSLKAQAKAWDGGISTAVQAVLAYLLDTILIINSQLRTGSAKSLATELYKSAKALPEHDPLRPYSVAKLFHVQSQTVPTLAETSTSASNIATVADQSDPNIQSSILLAVPDQQQTPLSRVIGGGSDTEGSHFTGQSADTDGRSSFSTQAKNVVSKFLRPHLNTSRSSSFAGAPPLSPANAVTSP
jgi:serine/threonine protein kinase